MEKIAVLIPCYNEAVTIGKVVADWKQALPEATIYVYDNNSTDDTAAIAAAAGAVVRHEPVQGKGNVMRRMFLDIEAECYVMVDGDDTYPASFARQLIAPVLERNADMVIGDRLSSTYFKENKRPFHNFGNELVRKTINLLFRSNLKDIMTGYRAMSYRFVKTFPVLSKGFEIETEMTIHAVDKNMRIENVVVDYKDRPAGSKSKLNTVSDGAKVLLTLFKLFKNYKPFPFFASLAANLAVFSSILFYPVLFEYLETGLVARYPTLIVSGFSSLAGIISLFTGLILDVLIEKEKQDFEFKLQLIRQFQRERANG